MEQPQSSRRAALVGRVASFMASRVLWVRSWTDVPIRAVWRRWAIARASGLTKTQRQAEMAWWQGDAISAIEHWRGLEGAEPSLAQWPLKISRALVECGDFAAAEQVLSNAKARGVEGEDVDLSLSRCLRASRRLNSAIEDAEAVVADPTAPPRTVFDAGFYLMTQNRFEGARMGLTRLLDDKGHGSIASGMLAALSVLEQARADGRPDIPGWVSPAQSSILIREPSSDTLVVGFALPSSALGLPLNAVHAMLSSKGVNALYLYDSRQVLHLAGTDRFGPGYQAMLDGIRALATELGTRRLITMGGSATGYTAIRVALDLDADGVLAFVPQTMMPRDASYGVVRSAHTLNRLKQFASPMMTNLRGVVEARRPRPRIEIYYGEGDRIDRMHAGNLAGLDKVHLNAIRGLRRHNVLAEMVRRGYRDLLDVFPAA